MNYDHIHNQWNYAQYSSAKWYIFYCLNLTSLPAEDFLEANRSGHEFVYSKPPNSKGVLPSWSKESVLERNSGFLLKFAVTKSRFPNKEVNMKRVFIEAGQWNPPCLNQSSVHVSDHSYICSSEFEWKLVLFERSKNEIIVFINNSGD